MFANVNFFIKICMINICKLTYALIICDVVYFYKDPDSWHIFWGSGSILHVPVILTRLCLGPVSGELQYFLRTPSNTSVAEGDSAVLVCQVGNLQGRVQWTKDGLTLGKYSYVWFVHIGVRTSVEYKAFLNSQVRKK